MTATLKSLAPSRVQVKNADLGEVEAVFATLKTIDADGDVILPGAIADGTQVVISAFMHESWKGKLPVGRGTIHEDGDELVVKARFFMDTTHGADTFATVKGLAGTDSGDDNLGEWSFSLQDVVSTKSKWDGKTANVISQIGRVKEVSPVLEGAGVNTRTLIAKSLDDATQDLDDEITATNVALNQWSPSYGNTITITASGTAAPDQKSGRTFSEHLESVLADVKALTTRAEEVMALRAAKGKSLGDDARRLLSDLATALADVKALTEQPDTPQTEHSDIDPEAEYLRFVAFTHGVN